MKRSQFAERMRLPKSKRPALTIAKRRSTKPKRNNPVSVFQQVPNTPERKNVDIVNIFQTPTSGNAPAGALVLINGIAQGISANQHTGRKAIMTSIQLRMDFASTGVTPICGSRILVVYDKESNNAAPAALDILTTDDPTSSMNLNSSDRFIIIADETLMPHNMLATSSTYHWQFYRKVALPIVFSGTGATVASIETGAVYVMSYCPGIGAGVPTLGEAYGYARVRYTDV